MPSDLRRRARRLLRRRRRPLAAALAALAVVILAVGLRSPGASPGAVAVSAGSPGGLRPGEVRVPVTLGSPAIVATLSEGDLIDLVAVDEAGARVVAPRARVVALGSGGSALSASSPVIVVAMPAAGVLDVVAAADARPLSVIVRQG